MFARVDYVVARVFVGIELVKADPYGRPMSQAFEERITLLHFGVSRFLNLLRWGISDATDAKSVWIQRQENPFPIARWRPRLPRWLAPGGGGGEKNFLVSDGGKRISNTS